MKIFAVVFVIACLAVLGMLAAAGPGGMSPAAWLLGALAVLGIIATVAALAFSRKEGTR